MSVLFRLHQDQSVGTKRSGKWYARAVPIGVIDTRGLSEIIQRNCTVILKDFCFLLNLLTLFAFFYFYLRNIPMN